jgi:hypothetical protein
MPMLPDDLREALRDADWESLLPNLLAYAKRRLRRAGWLSGELVNTAVERCLDGKVLASVLGWSEARLSAARRRLWKKLVRAKRKRRAR